MPRSVSDKLYKRQYAGLYPPKGRRGGKGDGRSEQPMMIPPEDAAAFGLDIPPNTDMLTEQELYPAGPESADEVSFLKETGKGLVHGLTQIAADVGTGIEIAAGATENALEGIGIIDDDGNDENYFTRLGTTVDEYWKNVQKGYEAHPELRGDVVDNPELMARASWWGYNTASFLPSLAVSMIGGILGFKAVTGVAKLKQAQQIAQVKKLAGISETSRRGYKAIKIGPREIIMHPQNITRLAKIGGLLSGGYAGGALEGSSTYREMLENGATPEEARMGAYQMTLASGVLNAISLSRLLDRVPGQGPMKRVARHTLNGIVEGISEWLEEPAEILIKMNMSDGSKYEFTPEEAAQQMNSSFNVLGPAALVGFLMPGGGGALPSTTQDKDVPFTTKAPKQLKTPHGLVPEDDFTKIDIEGEAEQPTPEEVEAMEIYGEGEGEIENIEGIDVANPDIPFSPEPAEEAEFTEFESVEEITIGDETATYDFAEGEYGPGWSTSEKQMFDLLNRAAEVDPTAIDMVEEMAVAGESDDAIMLKLFNIITMGRRDNGKPEGSQRSGEIQGEPSGGAQPGTPGEPEGITGTGEGGQDSGYLEPGALTPEELEGLVEEGELEEEPTAPVEEGGEEAPIEPAPAPEEEAQEEEQPAQEEEPGDEDIDWDKVMEEAEEGEEESELPDGITDTGQGGGVRPTGTPAGEPEPALAPERAEKNKKFPIRYRKDGAEANEKAVELSDPLEIKRAEQKIDKIGATSKSGEEFNTRMMASGYVPLLPEMAEIQEWAERRRGGDKQTFAEFREKEMAPAGEETAEGGVTDTGGEGKGARPSGEYINEDDKPDEPPPPAGGAGGVTDTGGEGARPTGTPAGEPEQAEEPEKGSAETIDIPTSPKGDVKQSVPRYMYHQLVGRSREADGSVAPYKVPDKERELLNMFKDKERSDKVVYMSPTESEGALKIDLSKLDINELRPTGQVEGNVIYRGKIPAEAIEQAQEGGVTDTGGKDKPKYSGRGGYRGGGRPKLSEEEKARRAEERKKKKEQVGQAVADVEEALIPRLKGRLYPKVAEEGWKDDAHAHIIDSLEKMLKIERTLGEGSSIEQSTIDLLLDPDGQLNNKAITKPVLNRIKREIQNYAKQRETDQKNAHFVTTARAHLRGKLAELDADQRHDYITGFRHGITNGPKTGIPGLGIDVVKGFTEGQAFLQDYKAEHSSKVNKDGGMKLRRVRDFRKGEHVEKVFMDNLRRYTSKSNVFPDHKIIVGTEEATGGVYRAYDEFLKDVLPFTEWIGIKLGGGRGEWDTSFADVIHRKYTQDPDWLAEKAEEYVASLHQMFDFDAVTPISNLARLKTVVLNDYLDAVWRKRYDGKEFVSSVSSELGTANIDFADMLRTGVDPYVNFVNNYEALKESEDEPYEKKKRSRNSERNMNSSLVRVGFPEYDLGEEINNEQDKIKKASLIKKKLEAEFGFFQVFRGEYVNDDEWVEWLVRVYESFNDITQLIGIPKKALGMGGRLWLGIGALGAGGSASAHFTPGHPLDEMGQNMYKEEFGVNEAPKLVPAINITKTMGNGAFFHEWFHALDFYLRDTYDKEGASLGVQKVEDITSAHPMRGVIKALAKALTRQVFVFSDGKAKRLPAWYTHMDPERVFRSGNTAEEAFQNFYDSLKDRMSAGWGFLHSDMFDHSLLLDKNKGGGAYWSTPHEMLARAAEAFMYDITRAVNEENEVTQDNNWYVNHSTLEYGWDQGDERVYYNSLYKKLFEALEFEADGTPKKTINDNEDLIDHTGDMLARLDEWVAENKDEIIKELDAELKNLSEERAKADAERDKQAKKAEEEGLWGDEETQDFGLNEDPEEQDTDIEDDFDVPTTEATADDGGEIDWEDVLNEAYGEDGSHDKITPRHGESAGVAEEAKAPEPYVDPDDEVVEDDVELKDVFLELKKSVREVGRALDAATKTTRGSVGSALGQIFTQEAYEAALPHLRQAAMHAHRARDLAVNYMKWWIGFKTMDGERPTDAEIKEQQKIVEHFRDTEFNSMNRLRAQAYRLYLQSLRNNSAPETADEFLQFLNTNITGSVHGGATTDHLWFVLPSLQGAMMEYLADQREIAPDYLYIEAEKLDGILNELWKATESSRKLTMKSQFEPLPMALGAVLAIDAGVGGDGYVLDATAGTGGLLLYANPNRTHANDLNTALHSPLVHRGFAPTNYDASIMVSTKKQVKQKSKDIVLISPPAGKSKEPINGFEWKGEAIAYQSLLAMKDDGKALIIMKREPSPAMMGMMRGYNVRDYITVGGYHIMRVDGRRDPADAADVPAVQVFANLKEAFDYIKNPLPLTDEGLLILPEPTKAETPEPETTAEPAGGREGTAPPPAEGVEVPIEPDTAPEGVGEGRGERGEGKKPKELEETEDDYQMEWQTFSEKETDEKIYTTPGLAEAMREAFEKLVAEVGSLDEYVTEMLGYDSVQQMHYGEGGIMGLHDYQVESLAMAIYQAEQGKAVIIGDQTGVGKGRQAAGMIRYAMRKGFVPVFVTKAINLYGPMLRDLQAIGVDAQPMITNAEDVFITDNDGNVFFKETKAERGAMRKHLMEQGSLPEGRNVVFTTYDQISQSAAARNSLLGAKNTFFILDESHNAAGSKDDGDGSNVNRLVTGMLEASKGATFLSATFAKEPESLRLYATKTDMSDVPGTVDDVVSAMRRGKDALTTVVSEMLARSGQYIRRERSLKGIEIPTVDLFDDTTEEGKKSVANVHSKYNELAAIVHAINKLSVAYADAAMEVGAKFVEDKLVEDNGGIPLEPEDIPKMNFASFKGRFYDIINQMLLSVKADGVADMVIKTLDDGEKPVVGTMNTLGQFLKDTMELQGLKAGDEIKNFNWATLLDRIFVNMMYVSASYGDKDSRNENLERLGIRRIPISIADIEAHAVGAENIEEIKQLHTNVIDSINRLSLFKGIEETMPVSPLDWIIDRVKKAGYDMREITGRDMRVDYSDPNKPKLVGIKGKNKTEVQNWFQHNQGKALLINISGSTGIDLHSSESDAKDLSRRHMLIIQPDQNINTYMQMLGRVNRYGQVNVPRYSLVRAPVPAEERLFAMITKKLASLNATTSSATKSRSDIEMPNFLNAIGDKVVETWLKENQQTAELFEDLLSRDRTKEGIARKISGGIGVLPISVQSQFYSEVIPAYERAVAEAKALGEYEEEKVFYDYRGSKAGTMDINVDEELLAPTDESKPFRQGGYWSHWVVRLLQKPYTREVARKRVLKTLMEKGKDPADSEAKPTHTQLLENVLTRVRETAEKHHQYWSAEVTRLEAEITELRNNNGAQAQIDAVQREVDKARNRAGNSDPAQVDSHLDAIRDHILASKSAIQRKYGRLYGGGVTFYPRDNDIPLAGYVFQFTLGEDSENVMMGVVSDVVYKFNYKEGANPFTLSNFRVTIESNGALKTIKTPITRVHVANDPPAAPILAKGYGDNYRATFETPDTERGETIERLVTGNVFGAMVRHTGLRGTIIEFSDAEGNKQTALKLAPSVDLERDLKPSIYMPTTSSIISLMEAGETVFGGDDRVQLIKDRSRGTWQFRFPGAKNFIEKYLTRSGAAKVLAGKNFEESGRKRTKKFAILYNDEFTKDEVVALIDALRTKMSFYSGLGIESRDKAKEIIAAESEVVSTEKPAFSIHPGRVTGSMHSDDVWKVLGDILPEMSRLGIPIQVVQRQSEIDIFETRKIKGRYDPVEGITLVAEHLADAADVRRTLRHELFAHYGLRRLLGVGFSELIQAVREARQISKPIAKLFTEVEALYPDLNEAQLAEEVIARVSSRYSRTPLFKRLYSAIVRFLRAVGLYDGAITVSEISSLIDEAEHNIRTGRTNLYSDAPTFGSMDSRDFTDSGRYETYTEEELDALKRADAKEGYHPEGFLDRIERTWLEVKHDFWRRAEQGIFDRYRALRDVDMHGWMMARMSHSASGVLEYIVKHGGILRNMVGGVGAHQYTNKSLMQVLEPLGDETKDFFRWIAAHRAVRLMREGKENWMEPDEVKAWMKLAEGNLPGGGSRLDLYNKVKHDFMALHENVLDYGVRTGVIGKAERSTWNNEFYVPFFRLLSEEDESGAGPRMLDGITGQTAYKHLKGAERQLGDLLTNVLGNWHHIIQSGMKNDAAKQIVKSALRMQEPPLVKTGKKTKGAIYIRQKGVKKYYFVRDNLLLDALTSITETNRDGILMPAMRTMKRVFTIGVTSSPEFMLANLIRDTIHSAAVSPINKNLIDNVVTGWRESKEGTDIAERMLVGGGALHFGYRYGADPDAVDAMIAGWRKKGSILSGENPSQYITNGLGKMFEKWQELGSRFENVNRTALYAQKYDAVYKRQMEIDPSNPGLAKAMAEFEANFQARDLLDFSQSGSFPVVKFLIQVIPFLNARLQGLNKLWRSGNDPAQRKEFFAVMATYVLASVALYLMYHDDDDFKKREEWDRDSYHWARIPGTNNAIRIPRPFELGVASTIAERMLEQWLDDEANGALFRERMMFALTQTFEFDPVPQLFRPVYNVATNKDPFTKRRIESMAMEGLPVEQRRSLWTSETSIVASKALKDVSFGAVKLSPVQIDHLIRGYFGWVGATTVDLTDFAITKPMTGAPTEPAMSLSQYPIVGRFIRDLPEPRSKYVTTFYEQAHEVREAVNGLRNLKKLGQGKEAREYAKENRDVLKYGKVFKKNQKKLSKINAKIMQIRMSRKSREEKKRLIDKLNQAKIKIAQGVVTRVDDL